MRSHYVDISLPLIQPISPEGGKQRISTAQTPFKDRSTRLPQEAPSKIWEGSCPITKLLPPLYAARL